MPYQNNNNRIVPDAVEDRAIKPAATATDKRINYALDNSGAAQWANTANALASLGKGLMEMDTLWKYESQENAIRARFEAESAGGNKNDWRDVSKKIKGAAIFNPYNDNAFRQLQSQDITRQAVLEIVSTPEIEKMDSAAVQKLISDQQTKMMEAFKETGLSPKDYGTSLVQWRQQMDDFYSKYTVSNKAHKFGLLNTKLQSELTYKIEALFMDIEDEAEKVPRLRELLENEVKTWDTETGVVAADTQAKNLMGALKNYIARNAGQIDDKEILAAISDFSLPDGTPLSQVIPNYDVAVKDLLSQAREADLRQMELEVKVKDFKQEQMSREIMTDFMDKYTKGELASPDARQQYANDMIQKYKLDGVNSVKLLKSMAAGEDAWWDTAKNITDPRVKTALGVKVMLGEATVEEIAGAMNEHKLSAEDGFHLLQNFMSKEQKQQTAENKRVVEHLKAAKKEMIEGYHTGDSDIDAILLDPDQQTSFQNKLMELNERYQKDGDYQKFNDELAKWKSAYKQYAVEQEKSGAVTGFAAGFESLRSTPAISQSQWSQSSKDINQSINALKQMGLIKNQMGWDDSTVTTVSNPQQHRKITVTDDKGNSYTKDTRHTGYDLRGRFVVGGRQVYAPMEGTVVGVQPEAQSGGQGNMVLVQCANGKLIKYMHLQHADLPSVGQKVGKNIPVGRIGNTGATETLANGQKAYSLHVEFYDANKQWITAKQFMES